MFDSSPAGDRPVFRIDPWMTDYGTSLQTEDEDGADFHPDVDPTVETANWDEPLTPFETPRPEAIVFVDGVQRIEAWGFLDAGERSAEAALASVGVGAVACRAEG